MTLADGVSLSGVVLNQSTGEMQLLGDDRRVHLLRETTAGRYREVTSQTGWTTYNGQASGNRYSTLTQITAATPRGSRRSGSSRCPTRRRCR